MGYCGAQWFGQHSSQQALHCELIEGDQLSRERLNASEKSGEQIIDALQRELRSPSEVLRSTTLAHQRQLSRRIIEAIAPSGAFSQRNLRHAARAELQDVAERTSGAADTALRSGMRAPIRASGSGERASGRAAARYVMRMSHAVLVGPKSVAIVWIPERRSASTSCTAPSAWLATPQSPSAPSGASHSALNELAKRRPAIGGRRKCDDETKESRIGMERARANQGAL
jgi:hypothetical protein